MFTVKRKFIFFIMTLLFSSFVLAATTWKIDPAASKITFTATQNGAPVTGEFKSFSGDIVFDPVRLDTSSVSITIDMGSVTASYGQVTDTLKTPDWFNVSAFPKAVFKATHFTKTGDKSYTADGSLTIRDKTAPVTLNFTFDKYTDTDAVVKGTAKLMRTAFGVGQGDWAKTDNIKDEVTVDIQVTAKKNK